MLGHAQCDQKRTCHGADAHQADDERSQSLFDNPGRDNFVKAALFVRVPLVPELFLRHDAVVIRHGRGYSLVHAETLGVSGCLGYQAIGRWETEQARDKCVDALPPR